MAKNGPGKHVCALWQPREKGLNTGGKTRFPEFPEISRNFPKFPEICTRDFRPDFPGIYARNLNIYPQKPRKTPDFRVLPPVLKLFHKTRPSV